MTEVSRKRPHEDDEPDLHSSVFERYNRTMSLQDKLDDPNGDASVSEQADVEMDVAPLPQPKLPRDKSLYSQERKNKNLDWLTEPEYHDTLQTKPFKEFEPAIDSAIISNLESKFGISSAFSVQINVIESLMRDIAANRLDPTPFGDYLVNASTGSGKTLAYLIPIVHSLIGRVVPRIRCIILVPTKPLITQVYATILQLTRGININALALRSDTSVKEETDKLATVNPDILVTTPGRLVEHVTNGLDLSQLRFLVVDEADRLLNQSFQNWCDVLVSKLEQQQQFGPGQTFYNTFGVKCTKLIFSATLTTDSEKLHHLKLFKPKLIVINNTEQLVNELYQIPLNLEEKYIRVNEKLSFFKPMVLLKFLQQQQYSSHGLVFTKSNESAIRLSRLLSILCTKLQLDLDILCINYSLKTQQRTQLLRRFDEQGGILVATDLIARGMNMDSIKFVVNYDLPLSTKEYIHRVGRTARANRPGTAFTLCFGDGEYKWFKKLVYSGGVINRNGKQIDEIKVVRQDDEHTAEDFVLELDRDVYDESLDLLEKEIKNTT
ncbi:hypothetical protein OGAPHI_001071 [Ogataea philodendri]|uniref:ATP-dependent RNA helicase n=1 Tax=Ogataea philodendri TaxID=1378263 RepID=A0A9P8PES8_9ASCO|nr:uncharacterized protein OGAPHI_001071 [Ogataea philodendri]KAH3670556.1 hypothetical protein OGAPHI_001071 [Ogataea philodendri]